MGRWYVCGLLALATNVFGCVAAYEEPEIGPGPGRSTAVFGTNLNAVADWSPELMGVDLFKMSRKFFSGSEEQWEDQRALDLDADGWVRSLDSGQVARTLMLSDEVRYPAGDYVVLYEGAGTVEYGYNGRVESVEHRGSGREVVSLDPHQGGLSLTIVDTDPEDYLRNIRILIPGGSCEQDANRFCDDSDPCDGGECIPFERSYQRQLFNPDFVESIAGYGVLRFMDWMQTNGSTQADWKDRPLPTDATWSTRGVPVETMVELANRVGKDPWFCMPHLADDDYVDRFASYVRDHLDPGRTAYVEYSNEVWNSYFPQAEYAARQGVALGLGVGFEAQLRFYARRATQVHQIWERVFGDSSRLIRVTGSQQSNAWVTGSILGYKDTAAHTDVVAIAPYFGSDLGVPEQQSRVEQMSLDRLMAELRDKWVPSAIREIAAQARVAHRYGTELVAYEGGQHLVGLGASVESDRENELFDAANRDPRMKELYALYLQGWRNSGGHLFVHFTSCGVPTKYGRWGALEWMQQPRESAPKFDAIMEFISSNPQWW
jgi:hypothetical protein